MGAYFPNSHPEAARATLASMLRPKTILAIVLIALPAAAASKPQVTSLGKAMPVKLLLGSAEEKTVAITVRPLTSTPSLKEYTTGPTHDVTACSSCGGRIALMIRFPAKRQASPGGFGSADAGC